MKNVFAGTCLAAAFAVGLAAQTPAQTPAQSAADRNDKTVTLTGCIRTGDEPSTFVLANVKRADKSKATEPSATGTSGSASDAAILKGIENGTLKLEDAPSSVKLSEHVGHTVQVTGEIDKDGDMSRPSTATGAAAGEQTGAKSASTAKPEHSFKVRTLTMVSASCTPMN